MTNDEIRELIELVTGDRRRGTGSAAGREPCSDPAIAWRPIPVFMLPRRRLLPRLSAAPAPPANAGQTRRAESPAAKAPPDSLVYVKSPIVGTFYEAASPDNPPFVRIGEHVQLGKVLCIIESMKLMNEIETDVAGVMETQAGSERPAGGIRRSPLWHPARLEKF